MARGLSEKQKTILEIIYNYERDHPYSIGSGTNIRHLYKLIKDKLYSGKRYISYQTSKSGKEHRQLINGGWVSLSTNEIKKYQNHLATIRASISRAIKGLTNRKLLIKDGYLIYLSESGRSLINN